TGADEALFGDRGVAYPVRSELAEQARGDLVGPLEDTDLLPHHEDALVAQHLLAHREAERLTVGHRHESLRVHIAGVADPRRCLGRAHSPKPPAKTSSRSPNGEPGNIRANCAALPGAYMPVASVLIGGGGLASATSTASATCSSAALSSASSSASDTPSCASSERTRKIGSCWRCSSISPRVR